MALTNEEWEARYAELRCLHDGNEGAEGGEISLNEEQVQFLGLTVDEDTQATAAGGYMIPIPEFLAAFQALERKPRTKADGRKPKPIPQPDPNKGPTIEEWLDAGYLQENYPPEGYNPRKSKLNPDGKAGKDLPKLDKKK